MAMKVEMHLVMLVAVIAALLFAAPRLALAAGVEGTAKADAMDACVAPTPFMRRSHFELIKHQRDVTVHQGIRLTDNSLAGCVDCHVRKDVSGAHVAIDAPGEFCAACHEYTATTLDCFTCHATTPVGN